MTLLDRLNDITDRRERELSQMDPSDKREIARQEVADLREAVQLLRKHGPGRWKRFKRLIAGRPITTEEWEDLQW